MAEVAPLTPLRFDLARLAHQPTGLGAVVAPPYDVISPEERALLAARDPHNIVHLILPEGDGDGNKSKYAHAAELLARWTEERVLVRDPEPGFYRLDQTFAAPGGSAGSAEAGHPPPTIVRRGFLALVRLVPFAERVVLPHERTLSGPKEDRLKLFRATQANLSPGFMLYADPSGELDAPLATGEPLAEFRTADGVSNVLAKVRSPDAIRAIIRGIARSKLLIADGHHRYETALRYAGEVSAAHPLAPLSAEHRFFMTFLANGDSPTLVVFPTHRHVHSLSAGATGATGDGRTSSGPTLFDDLLRRAAADVFAVTELAPGSSAGAILAALAGARPGVAIAAAAPDGRAAVLSLRTDVDLRSHPTLGKQPATLRTTDVVVLHAGVLEPLLGITPEAQAAKTNIWYPQDAHASLTSLRAGSGNLLFLMNATPVAHVRAAAEAGEVMPQKSTYFYPKIPTGLAVHTLDPTRGAVLASAELDEPRRA
jgi:uncharacterized protein (DUF1015 family)